MGNESNAYYFFMTAVDFYFTVELMFPFCLSSVNIPAVAVTYDVAAAGTCDHTASAGAERRLVSAHYRTGVYHCRGKSAD